MDTRLAYAVRQARDIFSVRLQDAAKLVLTDSAGIQEESSVLGTPCLTLRTTTERPITLEQGTAVLVGEDPQKLLRYVDEVLSGAWDKTNRIKLWDGQAAARVATALETFLNGGR